MINSISIVVPSYNESQNINEIYYLAGDSSVIESFETPDISLKSNTEGILNILQTLKRKKYKAKLFNAGSGQFYGDNEKNFYNILLYLVFNFKSKC